MGYKSIAALLLPVLAGCVGPVTVAERSTHFVYVTSKGPHRAAQCMLKNVSGRAPALVAEAWRATDADVWEVTVADVTGVVATARVDVASIVVRIRTPQPDNEKFANDLVGFC